MIWRIFVFVITNFYDVNLCNFENHYRNSRKQRISRCPALLHAGAARPALVEIELLEMLREATVHHRDVRVWLADRSLKRENLLSCLLNEKTYNILVIDEVVEVPVSLVNHVHLHEVYPRIVVHIAETVFTAKNVRPKNAFN